MVAVEEPVCLYTWWVDRIARNPSHVHAYRAAGARFTPPRSGDVLRYHPQYGAVIDRTAPDTRGSVAQTPAPGSTETNARKTSALRSSLNSTSAAGPSQTLLESITTPRTLSHSSGSYWLSELDKRQAQQGPYLVADVLESAFQDSTSQAATSRLYQSTDEVEIQLMGAYQAQVIKAFTASGPGQLTLKIGDVVEVPTRVCLSVCLPACLSVCLYVFRLLQGVFGFS